MVTLVMSFQREKGGAIGLKGSDPNLFIREPRIWRVQRKVEGGEGGDRVSKDHILDLQWIKELVKESGGIPSRSKGKTPHEYSQSPEQEALFASLNFPNAKCQDKQRCCPLGRRLLGWDGLFSNHSLSDKPLPSSLHLVLTSTVCPPLSPRGESRPSAKPQAEQIEGLSPVGKRPNPTRPGARLTVLEKAGGWVQILQELGYRLTPSGKGNQGIIFTVSIIAAQGERDGRRKEKNIASRRT